jgi:uncharacterized 2Fe-2S/4Fe-4S cluster protein (DUF4445 family)
MHKIYFPQYARGRDGLKLYPGESVLEHIRRLDGVEIDSECGGQGICGRDVIRLERGAGSLTELTDAEKHFLKQGRLKQGQRLACQARVADDVQDIYVFIANFGRYTILSDFIQNEVELKPSVFRRDGRVICSNGEDLGPYEGKILGLAIDIGTTTLVMQVVDLETGKNVGQPLASKNPQIAYGNEVISRIGYTIDNEYGLKELQGAVIDGINLSLEELEKQLGKKVSINKHIYDVAAVGNSTMRNLFLGEDVHNLGVIPFEAASISAFTKKAAEIGLNIHHEAKVYAPPLIGGHAGSDCLADIIATGLYENTEIGMIIDIGTNGEVVVGNRDKILTASCAAGGAYEGYQIRCGVGAIEGAITKLKIDNGQVHYSTLGDKPPLGVCGSGVIDLLAELLRNGIMNQRARIQRDFHITDNISISQDDINQLIMAKAGLRTDQDLLIRYYGITLDEVKKIYLAGAFGNFMNLDNAMDIGLLPKIHKGKFVRYGNGALAGARDMLVSKLKRGEAENLKSIITHFKPNEIEGENFQYLVADNIYFDRLRQ